MVQKTPKSESSDEDDAPLKIIVKKKKTRDVEENVQIVKEKGKNLKENGHNVKENGQNVKENVQNVEENGRNADETGQSDLNELKPHRCEFCEFVAESKYQIFVHNTQHIIIPLLNLHTCQTCSRYFESSKFLDKHIAKDHIDISSFINKVPKLILNDFNNEIIKDFDDLDKIEGTHVKDEINCDTEEGFKEIKVENVDDGAIIQVLSHTVKSEDHSIREDGSDFNNVSCSFNETSKISNKAKKKVVRKRRKEANIIESESDKVQANNSSNTTKVNNVDIKVSDALPKPLVPIKKRLLFEDDSLKKRLLFEDDLPDDKITKTSKDSLVNISDKGKNIKDKLNIDKTTCDTFNVMHLNNELNNTIVHNNLPLNINHNNLFANAIIALNNTITHNTLMNNGINHNNFMNNGINHNNFMTNGMNNNNNVMNNTVMHNHSNLFYNTIPNGCQNNDIFKNILPFNGASFDMGSNAEEFILPDITNGNSTLHRNVTRVPENDAKVEKIDKTTNPVTKNKRKGRKNVSTALNEELKKAAEELNDNLPSGCDSESVHYDVLILHELVSCDKCEKVFLNRLSCIRHEMLHMRVKLDTESSIKHTLEHLNHRCSKSCSKLPKQRHITVKRCDFCKRPYKIWANHFKKYHKKVEGRRLLWNNEHRLKNITKRLKRIKLGKI